MSKELDALSAAATLTEQQINEIGKRVADSCVYKHGSNNHIRVWLVANLGVRETLKVLRTGQLVPRDAVEELASAAAPFARHNASTDSITINVQTAEIARLRAALTAIKGGEDAVG